MHTDRLSTSEEGYPLIPLSPSRVLCFQPMEKPFTDNPPSIQMTCPVVNDGPGRQRNATTEETSPGSPARPMGVR